MRDGREDGWHEGRDLGFGRELWISLLDVHRLMVIGGGGVPSSQADRQAEDDVM